MRVWCPTSLALSLLLAVSSAASAQVGSIRGRVIDSTGAPLAGALLAVDRTNVRAQSSTSGAYVLLGVPAGVHFRRHPKLPPLVLSAFDVCCNPFEDAQNAPL